MPVFCSSQPHRPSRRHGPDLHRLPRHPAEETAAGGGRADGREARDIDGIGEDTARQTLEAIVVFWYATRSLRGHAAGRDVRGDRGIAQEAQGDRTPNAAGYPD